MEGVTVAAYTPVDWIEAACGFGSFGIPQGAAGVCAFGGGREGRCLCGASNTHARKKEKR